MELHVLNFFQGYVRVRITGNSYDRFLNLCAYHNIRLWDLLPSGDSYEACITRKDFRRLKEIVRKSHVTVRIVRRQGLPFFIHKHRKRKVYAAGVAAAFLFMAWLSAHIWNISIEGNVSQTDDIIFEYLEQEGIVHGMRKSGIDCKSLASQIRNYFTQFSWVAAELKGTRLIIYVKEGILAEEDSPVSEQEATSLAASKNGTVVEIYVRKGMPMVAAGDAVEKGTLLVSGALPVYNDSGEIVSWQYVNSDADIVIRREMQYSDTVSLVNTEKVFTGKQKTRYMIRIGDRPFALPGSSFDSFEQYTMLSELTQLRLMENFYLPLYVQKFTAKEYENLEMIYTKEEAVEILESNLRYFMKNLEEKGVQIFENDVKIEWTEKSAIATGTVTVGEYAVVRVAAEQTEEELQENEYG